MDEKQRWSEAFRAGYIDHNFRMLEKRLDQLERAMLSQQQTISQLERMIQQARQPKYTPPQKIPSWTPWF